MCVSTCVCVCVSHVLQLQPWRNAAPVWVQCRKANSVSRAHTSTHQAPTASIDTMYTRGVSHRIWGGSRNGSEAESEPVIE